MAVRHMRHAPWRGLPPSAHGPCSRSGQALAPQEECPLTPHHRPRKQARGKGGNVLREGECRARVHVQPPRDGCGAGTDTAGGNRHEARGLRPTPCHSPHLRHADCTQYPAIPHIYGARTASNALPFPHLRARGLHPIPCHSPHLRHADCAQRPAIPASTGTRTAPQHPAIPHIYGARTAPLHPMPARHLTHKTERDPVRHEPRGVSLIISGG